MKFLFSLVLLMAGLAGAVYMGAQYNWFSLIPSYTLEIIFFLGISTAVIYFILARKSESLGFAETYLLSIVLKMIVFSAFILVIILLDKPGAFANALLFIVSYILSTALEVGFLFRRINR